ncbi:hypothetical protein PM082_019213 [Marasmius tenuissimus]|nr:hypothetical protein PM082_019213 [Marasmius tenuissimus]
MTGSRMVLWCSKALTDDHRNLALCAWEAEFPLRLPKEGLMHAKWQGLINGFLS